MSQPSNLAQLLHSDSASSASEDHDEGADGSTYHLQVLQHPQRAAEFRNIALLSRLPVAPPVVVRITVFDEDNNLVRGDTELPFLVAHLSLWSGDGSEPVDVVNPNTAVTATPSANRMLYGTLVSSPHNLVGMNGRIETYFIFPDVSIRSAGSYQLCITLMPVWSAGSTEVMGSGSTRSALATVYTQTFEVVPQADYVAPAETALTQHLRAQGALRNTQ